MFLNYVAVVQRLKNKNRCGTATLVFENPPSQR
jgi:hypothetical protein